MEAEAFFSSHENIPQNLKPSTHRVFEVDSQGLLEL